MLQKLKDAMQVHSICSLVTFWSVPYSHAPLPTPLQHTQSWSSASVPHPSFFIELSFFSKFLPDTDTDTPPFSL